MVRHGDKGNRLNHFFTAFLAFIDPSCSVDSSFVECAFIICFGFNANELGNFLDCYYVCVCVCLCVIERHG